MRISLTTFVDFVSASGTPKATVVKNCKNRDKYHPAHDYWKVLRDKIVRYHQDGGGPLPNLAAGAAKHKVHNYVDVAQGHKKWVGKKKLAWFKPATDIWSCDGVDVSVNPELGLTIKGQPHLIKLYFKADKLAKNRVDLITHLMKVTLADQSPPNSIMGVLDLHRAKLITPTVPISTLEALIEGEAAYWSTVWPKV